MTRIGHFITKRVRTRSSAKPSEWTAASLVEEEQSDLGDPLLFNCLALFCQLGPLVRRVVPLQVRQHVSRHPLNAFDEFGFRFRRARIIFLGTCLFGIAKLVIREEQIPVVHPLFISPFNVRCQLLRCRVPIPSFILRRPLDTCGRIVGHVSV